MKFNPKKHQRRSIRLKGYDYAQPGAYFVTLCACQRDCPFGEVVDGTVRLNALGKIVQDEWLRSMEIRREIRLYEDEYVVMPNHLHGIVWIIEPVGADGVRPLDGVRPPGEITPDEIHPDVQTPTTPPGLMVDSGALDHGDATGETGAGRGASLAPLHINRRARSLSSFIAGFKASVTSRAMRELDMTPIWQRNYYEHIIRDEIGLKKIWDYIDANPERWTADRFHPAAPAEKGYR